MKLVTALALLSVVAAATGRSAQTPVTHEDMDYHESSVVQNQNSSLNRFNRNEATADFWHAKAREFLIKNAAAYPIRNSDQVAKNIILFLGDGMSVPTLAAARALLGQRNGATGEEAALSFEEFPVAGLVKTYCVDAQVADSACSGTAYLTGVKTNLGLLGLTAGVTLDDCSAATNPDNQVTSLAAWALQAGKSAGIVTTTTVTHASPAAAFAYSSSRMWESDSDIPESCTTRQLDITDQLVNQFPGSEFKVILGGGRRSFLPNNVTDEEGSNGGRTDGRNLIDEWKDLKSAQNARHEYVWNTDTFRQAMQTPPEYLLGLFESSHMNYAIENNGDEPSLAELTEAAIQILSQNEEGFFLFVEGGRIDHAHHANLATYALDETIEFSEAIAKADQMLSANDTLLLVTADHAHVMSFNGYSSRGRPILGTNGATDSDSVPYMTLSYTNGPGYRTHVNGIRPDVTQEANFGAQDWESHVDVPLDAETHGGDDVAIFARGPMQHLFTGLFEQHVIPHAAAVAGNLPSPAIQGLDLGYTSTGHTFTVTCLLLILCSLLTLVRF